jgi:hypothetical protein
MMCGWKVAIPRKPERPDMSSPVTQDKLGQGPWTFQRPLYTLSRIILACAFLWAAVSKIQDPEAFAEAILGYRLVPLFFTAPAALILPFLELWSALVVIAAPRGLWRRAGAIILGVLLVVFMLATLAGLVRGLDFDCGCFGAKTDRRPGLVFFVQDIILLLASIIIIRFDKIHIAE